MDGTLMNKELKNLNQLSEESWRKLLEYFENNTLSLQERCSLLNEITGHKDMLMERSFKD
jgi:F0F1-type ATP synthase delta subunit